MRRCQLDGALSLSSRLSECLLIPSIPNQTQSKLQKLVCNYSTNKRLPSLTLEPPLSGAACVYACSPTLDPSNGQSASIKNFDSASAELAADVNKEYPNTKVIGYPLDIANEQETLGLIDDVLNACGRLDVWVCAAGWLGPAGIDKTGPRELQRGWEANGLAPFFALRYAPASMAKLCSKGSYPNAAPKDVAYGSIIVVSSVASTYGGEFIRGICLVAFEERIDVAGIRVLGTWLYDELTCCSGRCAGWCCCTQRYLALQDSPKDVSRRYW